MKNNPIIIEQLIDAKASDIWKAITNKDELSVWFFEIDDFTPVVGSSFTFYTGGEEQKYQHICKILEIRDERVFSFSWKYSDLPGDSVVTYKLSEHGGKTMFQLKHEGIGNFPQNDPLFTRQSFLDGWKELIEISLKEYIESK